ncbi:DUF3857 domain-containing transglutaminase family protein [Psychromonas aquimarina]|uniref:DUF3857 domain-containing transglutaminase family protein n=1 Tax=Psychromonas aquimarina TaxID=444919 RepID=UPI00146FA06C|nr:DUF3857 domain-containing protein [Psychromonas aquimarina]
MSTFAQTIQSNGFQYRIGPAEQWVTHNQYALPETLSGEPVNYLLVDLQVRFHNGDSTVYHRNVEQPLTTEGLKLASRIEVSFNPVYQKLVWHNVTVRRGGKKVNRLSPSAITLMQREESLDQEIVDGYITSMLVISDTRKGDVIDYSYSVEGRNPIYGEHTFYSSYMGWRVSIAKLKRRFLFVNNDTIQYKSYKFDQKPVISENNGVKEFQWSIENTKPVFVENDYPSWYRAYPQITFSSFENWKEVSGWAEPLYANREVTDPELLNFISEIKPLSKDEQIAKALQYVQGEIRYLGVELGVNSHKPHDPDDVFKNRFGDCKDKTLLLISILEKLSISAHPALVSTYGGITLPTELPSPSEFNHVITRVQGDSKVYWLDPTRNLQNGTLEQLGYSSYDNALVVGHPSIDLEQMPETAQKLPEIRTYEYFNVLSYEGPVDYQIVTEYTGIEAEYMQSQFARQGKLTMERKFLNYMNRLYPSLQSAAPLTFEHDIKKNVVTVTEFYHITDFFRKQPEYLLTDFYAYSIANYFSLPATVKRKSPLRHFSPVKVTHQSHVRYPEWLNMHLSNDSKTIDTPYFSLSFTEDYRDKSIITTHVYESKTPFVPVKGVSEHISQLRKAKNSLSKVYETAYEEDNREQILGEFIERLNTQVDRLKGEQL